MKAGARASEVLRLRGSSHGGVTKRAKPDKLSEPIGYPFGSWQLSRLHVFWSWGTDFRSFCVFFRGVFVLHRRLAADTCVSCGSGIRPASFLTLACSVI